MFKCWLFGYCCEGKVGLLLVYIGCVCKDYGWELCVIVLYNFFSKLIYVVVVLKLCKEGFDIVIDLCVMCYLKLLLVMFGENSLVCVGKYLYKLWYQKYQLCMFEQIKVGDIYVGDGYISDCYVVYLNMGGLFWLELMVFIDICLWYVLGWYLFEFELVLLIVFVLLYVMQIYDYLLLFFYLDCGVGYCVKMLNDQVMGFYVCFEMDVIGVLLGNLYGKGWIECWFCIVCDYYDKFFVGGQFYCGNDMVVEVNCCLFVEVCLGKCCLLLLVEYMVSLVNFIYEYNYMLMDVLDGCMLVQVWVLFECNLVVLFVEVIVWLCEKCIVCCQMVELYKCQYYVVELVLYDGKLLMIEYDLYDDCMVWLYDVKDWFVCQVVIVCIIGVVLQLCLEEQCEKCL